MKISIEFTVQELKLISRALTFGIIHTSDDAESKKMQALENKITVVGSLTTQSDEQRNY